MLGKYTISQLVSINFFTGVIST